MCAIPSPVNAALPIIMSREVSTLEVQSPPFVKAHVPRKLLEPQPIHNMPAMAPSPASHCVDDSEIILLHDLTRSCAWWDMCSVFMAESSAAELALVASRQGASKTSQLAELFARGQTGSQLQVIRFEFKLWIPGVQPRQEANRTLTKVLARR